MINKPSSKHILFTLISFILVQYGFSCSMYKITLGEKTMVGCNEDAWRSTPHIWFENASKTWSYGAAFTGSRFDGTNGYAPQSGMNEFGLSFSRLASYFPRQETAVLDSRKSIINPSLFLKDILHACKTVEEVEAYISQYDQSYFIEDVFIYVDRSGKYLVVEPYSLTIGEEANYVLSNFCPSITSESDALKLERYKNGKEFLKNKVDTTLAFCTALSDTMHVCRDKIGDGTLLTSIWDLNALTVDLYFYHQYQDVVHFDLKEALAKGDHSISIQTLFPANSEFEKLGTYKTTLNSNLVRAFLLFAGGLYFFSSFYFLLDYLKTKKNSGYTFIQLLLLILGFATFYYCYILFRNSYIFYFSSPYKDPHSVLISLSSYLPFVILVCIIPLITINIKVFKEAIWGSFSKWLFVSNNLVYMVLLVLFAYWGFFVIF